MKIRILLLVLLMAIPAYSADRLVTVCDAAFSGGACDYTSIEAALDANEMDIQATLGDGFNFIIEVDSAIDSDNASVLGYTTDVNNFIIIRPASGAEHGGAWNTAVYIYRFAKFAVGESFTVIDGIQFESNYTGGSNNPAIQLGTIGSSNQAIVRNCIIRFTGSSTAPLRGIRTGNSSDSVYIYNNLVYDFNLNAQSAGIWTNPIADLGGYVYNNTIVNCRIGLYSGENDMVAKNNIIFGCSLAVNVQTYGNNTSWNATDSSTLGYTVGSGGGNDSTDASFSFGGVGGDDFSLTSAFIGVDLSGDTDLAFSTDINGVTRSSWDRGAFEFIPEVGGADISYVRRIKLNEEESR